MNPQIERLEQFIDSLTYGYPRARILANASSNKVDLRKLSYMLFNESDAALDLASWLVQDDVGGKNPIAINVARQLRANGLQMRKLAFRVTNQDIREKCIRASFQKLMQCGTEACNLFNPHLGVALGVVGDGY